MRRINLFSHGMMSLLKLFARVLVIVLAVSLFQQAHSAQAVPVRPPHFDRRAMPFFRRDEANILRMTYP